MAKSIGSGQKKSSFGLLNLPAALQDGQVCEFRLKRTFFRDDVGFFGVRDESAYVHSHSVLIQLKKLFYLRKPSSQ